MWFIVVYLDFVDIACMYTLPLCDEIIPSTAYTVDSLIIHARYKP